MAFDKFKDFFKKEDEDDKDLESTYYDDSKDSLKEAEKNGNKMILMEPRSFSETQAIADHLKKRNSVVVNLKRVTSPQAKRIIDFLGGCIYAIGGNMEKIGVGIYLCTPKNVNVQGQITDESDKVKTGVEDDLDL
jgi:cell division inhibitor SepF